MGDEAILSRWKALAGDDSRRPWTPEHTAGFFQHFRPDGGGLAAAFEGVAGAAAILPRLREVYAATSEGWERGGADDGYFIVRKPRPLPHVHATDLLRRHLDRVAALAGAVGCRELTALLKGHLRLEAVAGPTPWPPGDDDPESLVYEATCDFMGSLTPQDSHALLMKPGFDTIACDPYLSYHILWPLYRHATPIEEPFRPYFDLWTHGAGYRFTGDGAVRVYVPAEAPTS